MATHKIAIKHPGKPLEEMDFEGTYRCDIKPLLGTDDGWLTLEYVMLRQTRDGRCLCLICDEDGLLKNLPFNFNMITVSGNHRFYCDLVGTVAFVCYQWEDVWSKEIYDFKLLDLNEEEISIVNTVLSVKYQKRVQTMRKQDPSIHYNEGVLTIIDPRETPGG